jgi:two-component system response regulator HupR/HoxA
VIDDEPFNRELIRRFLHRDYEVAEAADAAQAIAWLEETAGRVSLIICDQLMPGRSGTDFAAEVKARWSAIPIVLLTGYDDDDAVQCAFESGTVCEVVSKPWRGAQLKALVEDVLSRPRS